MNRGSDISAIVQCVRYEGFNEAPIHESGKSRPRKNGKLVHSALQ